MPLLPLWARALRGIDRAAWYAYHAHEITRNELFFACLKPELRSELTVLAYSDMRTYLPGGTTFDSGLFDWEKSLFSEPCLPRTGHVLLAAAGGGRELKALLESGYSVTAFEPNAMLFDGAAQVASKFGQAELLRGMYSDLTRAVNGEGPLATIGRKDFDWVLFGWGSFTHLTERSAQLDALKATRQLAPRAPLALSFFLRKQESSGGRSNTLRQFLRNALHRAGAAQPIAPGLSYDYGGGFVYSFTMDEIAELASLAHYRVVAQDTRVFPYVILLPA